MCSICYVDQFNCLVTGWSGEKIVVGGDSGGGNLSVALALKCLHLGVRPPDGLFAAYAPLNLQLTPSPSRLLCAMDPLIPLEFLLHCLHSMSESASASLFFFIIIVSH